MMLKYLGWIGICILCSMAIALLSTIVFAIVRAITEWLNVVAHYWLDIKDKNNQVKLNAVRVLRPDANGRQGVLFDGHVFRDADSGESFDILRTHYLDPMRLQMNEMQKTLLALQNIKLNKGEIQELLSESVEQHLAFRDYVTLDDLIKRHHVKPNYDNVILGETIVDGRYQIVSGSMSKFLHGIVTGRSGFGKSTQLTSVAKQLVMGQDCDVCFVDYGVNTFGMLSGHGLYPIADTPELATTLFKELVAEMNRRRSLMAEYPHVKTIFDYNDETESELRPIVCLVDESSTLFDKSNNCRDLVRELTSMGRKYGLGVVFGGTDFKVDTMPSETRGNCGLRQTFRLEEPGLSRSVIRSTEAVNLTELGRALAIIPGIPGLIQMQCPIVEKWDDLPKPRTVESLPQVKTLDELVLEEYNKGNQSISAVCRALGFHTGGDDFYKVRSSMQKQGFL